MPGTTPAQGWRIPIPADDPDVVDDMTQLAKLIEKRVIGVYATASARDAATTAAGLEEGMFAFTRDNNQVTYFDGTAWVAFPPMPPQILSGPSVPSNAVGNNGDVFFQV
jgi:hypothetical protein